MAALLNLIHRIRRCESGAEFIEMALAFPLLLLVVLGIMDFGIMFQRYEVMTNAAREGARLASLPDYCPSTSPATCMANVQARVDEYLDAAMLNSAPAGVCVGAACDGVATCEPVSGVSSMTVTVLYPHAFEYLSGIMAYFGSSFGSRTLTATSTMRTEIAAAGACP
jgi:Flp pilus assembly protein TadG